MVFQWPGSYCGAAKQACCYPKTGKPTKDFKIGGIWLFTFSGDRPTNCKSKTKFRLSNISNLTKSLENDWPSLSCPRSSSSKIWKHEWRKYGTCSEPLFGDQYQYFHAALNLRKKVAQNEMEEEEDEERRRRDDEARSQRASHSHQVIQLWLRSPGPVVLQTLIEADNDEMLAYETSADQVDEITRMGKSTILESLMRFCSAIESIYTTEYLRRPTKMDLQRLLKKGKMRGFPRMIGSINCMHWT